MKKNKWMRIGAGFLVCVLVGLVFLTLFFAITGSPYFMASLISMLFLPLLLYAYMYIYRLFKGKEERDEEKKSSLDNDKRIE